MKKLVLTLVLIGFALSLSGGIVVADTTGPFDPEGQEVPTLTTNQLFEKFSTAADWVFTVLVILSVFFILMAAFQFVTGGPEGVGEARQKLIWAAVGIAVGLLAKGIPALLLTVLE